MSKETKDIEETKDLKTVKTEVQEETKTEQAVAQTDQEIEELEEDFESSFFETDIEDIKNEGIQSDFVTDENLYTPSIEDEKAVNREYKSFIRFLKNPRRTKSNGKKNIVSKYVVFMQNPNNAESKIMVDDISHIDRNNIITNAFFHCRNSKSLAMQKLGKANFSRRSYNFTLIKIEKDVQHPDLENSIKVLRFANQVDEILTKALQDDPENEIHAKLYSDVMKGYRFVLAVNEKEVDDKTTKEKFMMVNYTDSRFVDTPSILQFDGIPADWHKTPEGRKEMLSHIIKNAPVLEDYEAKPWDTETEELVIEAVRTIIDNPTEFDKIYFKTYKKSYFGGDTVSNVDDENDTIGKIDDVEAFTDKPKATKASAPKIDDVVDIEEVEDIDHIDL